MKKTEKNNTMASILILISAFNIFIFNLITRVYPYLLTNILALVRIQIYQSCMFGIVSHCISFGDLRCKITINFTRVHIISQIVPKPLQPFAGLTKNVYCPFSYRCLWELMYSLSSYLTLCSVRYVSETSSAHSDNSNSLHRLITLRIMI